MNSMFHGHRDLFRRWCWLHHVRHHCNLSRGTCGCSPVVSCLVCRDRPSTVGLQSTLRAKEPINGMPKLCNLCVKDADEGELLHHIYCPTDAALEAILWKHFALHFQGELIPFTLVIDGFFVIFHVEFFQ